MKRKLIPLLALLLLAGSAGTAFALIVVQPVTKDTQAKEGLDFTLSAASESGTVWVKLAAPRKGKLATLSLVQLEVKDAQGKEVLLAPVATTDENEVIHAHFRITPEHAKWCNVILVTEQSKPPAPAFARHYSIAVKSYITQAKRN